MKQAAWITAIFAMLTVSALWSVLRRRMSLRLPNTIGELTAKDRRSGGLWVKQIGMYLLWFEYLAISPSYELARRYRAGETIPSDVLPSDFEAVLSVYDDLARIIHEKAAEVA